MKNLEYLLGTNREVLYELANNANSYYKPFIKITGDKHRHIDNPTGRLKKIQKLINKKILSSYTLPDYITGGRKGYSTRDNAKNHLNKKVVVRVDIKHCYPSTTDFQVFNIFKNYFGCSTKIASLLTRLTTYRKYLPQGASTSSSLVNLALLKMYESVNEIATTNNASFSAFVDDVCISGDKVDSVVEEIVKAIQREGYAVRNEKIKIMRNGRHQEITGITVNIKASVPREKMRTYINAVQDKNSPKKTAGLISYVNSINQKQGRLLKRRVDRN